MDILEILEKFRKYDVLMIDDCPAILTSDEGDNGWAEILFLSHEVVNEKYSYYVADRQKLGQIVWDGYFE